MKQANLGARLDKTKMNEKGDYYATNPLAVERVLPSLIEHGLITEKICEPACGEGHISRYLEDKGYIVESSDLYDRGFGNTGIDFLKRQNPIDQTILTNPPFCNAEDFILRSLELNKDHNCIMYLQLQFVATKKRKEIMDNYLTHLFILSGKIGCGINGDFSKKTSAIDYAWYVFSNHKQKGSPIHTFLI